MQTVTVTRTISASAEDVRDAMQDLEAFIRAAGFDEVSVDGRTVRVTNRVGVVGIDLELAVVDDSDADLLYEQRDGIFEHMRTAYTLTPGADSVELEARTEFELDVSVVGELLDATVIKRQRRKELEAQFDYVEEAVQA